jgi:hypothetical protein
MGGTTAGTMAGGTGLAFSSRGATWPPQGAPGPAGSTGQGGAGSTGPAPFPAWPPPGRGTGQGGSGGSGHGLPGGSGQWWPTTAA